MPKILHKIAAYLPTARKALVAVAGVVGQLAALGLFHGALLHDISIALAVVTALGVHSVPNAPAPAADESSPTMGDPAPAA